MNAHLWLTKYFIRYSELKQNKTVLGNGEKKSEFYKDLIDKYKAYWEGKLDPKWYLQRFGQYYSELAEGKVSKQLLTLQPTSSLLIGNGTTSILESHVTLHQIYGIPYIPGTAIKGIVAHFSHQIAGQQRQEFQRDGEIYNTLFGTTEQRGCIIFYDALPEPDSVAESLVLDIMTPHHQEYNQIQLNDKQKRDLKEAKYPAPRDDDSPEPIAFISANAVFRLMLTCEGNDEDSKEWLALACELVKQAIQSEGVGGKTNAGYGRFTVTKIE